MFTPPGLDRSAYPDLGQGPQRHREAGARFLAPARFGDQVELSSHVREFRRSSFDVEHRLSVGTTVAVEGHETRVWAARDPADPSKMKSQPIPAEVTARFRA